jgi:hypothetical protein
VCTFREHDVLEGGPREPLTQARLSGMWKDLIHAAPGHHVTAEEQLGFSGHARSVFRGETERRRVPPQLQLA